jgi:hypothetical protein
MNRHEHTRLIQLCPVVGEWFKVSVFSFPKNEPLPNDWMQLAYSERIVAWGLQERWSSHREYSAFTEDGDQLEGTEVTAIVAAGSTYGLVTDMLEADNDRNSDSAIGYFTKEDLTKPAVTDLIAQLAREHIEQSRKAEERRTVTTTP